MQVDLDDVSSTIVVTICPLVIGQWNKRANVPPRFPNFYCYTPGTWMLVKRHTLTKKVNQTDINKNV